MLLIGEFDPELYALQPWYHDFRSLGLDTTFLDVPLTMRERLGRARSLLEWGLTRVRGKTEAVQREGVRSVREVFRRVPSSHVRNQAVKDRHLMHLVEQALSGLGPSPECLELFSSDGYYSCRIKALSPKAKVTGVELDPDHLRRAEAVTRRLGFQDSVRFVRDDVFEFVGRSQQRYDLVLCAGGLYHVSDPAALLESIRGVARRYLVVQSVVTLETDAPDYFVHPAPGWRHGCRFTHAWLRARLQRLGWRVEDEARAELPGNPRLHDRGSSFFLCSQ